MLLMDHLECVESTLTVPTPMDLLNAPAHQDSRAILTNNASTSTNALCLMLAVKTQSVRTLRDPTHVFVLKAQLQIQTQLLDALLLSHATPTTTAPATPFAILTNAVFAQNQTSEMIAVIHANIWSADRTLNVDWRKAKPNASVQVDSST
jgi:spore maturation protein SpmA